MTKYVYDFSEGNKDMKDLLGGKGANLAEMTNMGLPVPPGFTITTEACLTFLANGGAAPPEMLREAGEHLGRLQETMGRKLGDPDDPLLVSVRSGAKFSMPGMMDTVLNLGLNDESVKGLAKQTGGDMRFANDAYRRFIQMFGKIVMDVPSDAFEHALDEAKERKGPGHAGHGSRRRRPRGADRPVPRDLPGAHRARRSRRIPRTSCAWPSTRSSRRGTASARSTTAGRTRSRDDLGTAVNIQAMVFGNRGDDSGTGVAFTRDPATGEKVPYGDYLSNAQGEDVVAGIRNTLRIAELEQLDPAAYAELRAAMDTLEGHYRDMCDIEFTIEKRQVLAAADARRQADRVRRVGDGLRHAGARADRRRRGAAARGREPPGGAVQAARRRGGGAEQRIADGPERVAGRRDRKGRVQRRRGAGVGRSRRGRDPGPS